MFKQKISITINSSIDRHKLFDEFEFLMISLCKTGQVTGDYETSFITGKELISFQPTLEKSSLSKKYNDEYVNQRIKNLEDWCHSKLKTAVIGKVIPAHKGVCTCKKPACYILFTHVFNDSGCIECGTCKKIVPLYKLTQLTSSDRYDIFMWESDYKSCDQLQLGCTVGEKWATKQMSDPGSQLSKEGIKICNRLKERTGVSTYYYLHNYRPSLLARTKQGYVLPATENGY